MKITVLAGPPCAGKTTLARRLAQPGDAVLDFDDVARSVGSPALWLHPEPYRTRAEQTMQLAIAQCYHSDKAGTAWVLRTAPSPVARASMAQQWGAEVYVINPGHRVCLARARARPQGTNRSIASWYHHYRPWHGDVAIPPAWLVHGDQATDA